jgi:hypothetical protein
LPSAIGKLNSNLNRVSDEFDKVLYTDGSNTVTGTLDANSNRIINLPDPLTDSEPATRGMVNGITTQLATGGSRYQDALNVGGLLGETDDISFTSRKDVLNLSGTRTKAKIAYSIVINDNQMGPQSSGSNPTPASASYGMSVVGIRPGWNLGAITGEMNGRSTFLRQGASDVAGDLYNIAVRNGFGAMHEGLVFGSDNSGGLVRAVRVQTGVVNNRDGGEFGYLTNAEKGSNLTAAFFAQSTPGTGASWQHLFKGNNPDAVTVFSVTGITGKIHSGNPSGWLESYRPNALGLAQIRGISSEGQNGVLGAARSSDSTQAGAMGCIGGAFYAINDNATQVQSAYATYIEATKMPGAGTTHAIEFDMVNRGTLISIDPHLTSIPDGITPGIWAASGGEFAANSASAAMVTVNNGAKWNKGLVFMAGSLDTRGDGKQEAISFGYRDALTFYGPNRNSIGNIYADGSSDGTIKTDLAFVGGYAEFRKADGTSLFRVSQTTTFTQSIAPFTNLGADLGGSSFRYNCAYTRTLSLQPMTFAALTSTFPAAANEGMIARISDASAAVTTFNQVISAGGGTNKATVISNGTNYVAISS